MMTTKEKPIMNRNLKTAATIAALGAAALLSGCEMVPMHMNAHYVPQPNVVAMPAAHGMSVHVIVKNDKKHHNDISYQKDEFGFDMAGVYMPVKKDFKNALEMAIKSHGFVVGNNGDSSVDVTVKKFFFSEHEGLLSLYETGAMDLEVSVKSNDGRLLYSKSIVISKYERDGSMFSSQVHEAANDLLKNGVNQLVDDRGFTGALLESGNAKPEG
jgi:uncharacterized lipoprotein YajG